MLCDIPLLRKGVKYMKNRIVFIGIIAFAVFFNGCAAIFASKTQDVSIRTNDDNDVLFLNGSDEKNNDGSYHLAKDANPVQVVVENENYRDEYFVLAQYKMSPLHIFSWVPGIIIGAFAFDYVPKAYSYPSSTQLQYERIPQIKKEADQAKNLWVSSVTAKLSNKNIFSVKHAYSKWISDPKTGDAKRSNSDQTFALTERITEQLNQLLEEKDLADKDLLGASKNTLYLSGQLEKVTMHYVGEFIPMLRNIVYAELEMIWNLKNAQEETIYSKKYEVTSGQFISSPQSFQMGQDVNKVLEDGIEKSFYLFMNDPQVKSEVYQSGKQETTASAKSSETVKIKPAKKYVSGVKQAIASSVTIKAADLLSVMTVIL